MAYGRVLSSFRGNSNTDENNFNATINVTYPTGMICTCTQNNTIYTAIDISGIATFKVNNSGGWIISYTNGVYTENKTVSITTNEEIIDIIMPVYLYINGDVCTDITGGWNTSSAKIFSNYTAKAPTLTYNSTNMKIKQNSGDIYTGVIKTLSVIDLTNYNKITVHYTFSQDSADNAYVTLLTANTITDDSLITASAKAQIAYSSGTTLSTTINLDISSIASGYIAIGLSKGHDSSATTVTITKIIME